MTSAPNALLTSTPASPAAPDAAEKRGRMRFLRAMLRNRSGKVAIVMIFVIVASAIFAPFITHVDPTAQNLANANLPPVGLGGKWADPLGTDGFGRDLFARLLFGARTSLFIGLVAASVSAMIGTFLGLLAGYYERTLGPFLLRFAEVQFSLPFTVTALAVVAVYGPGLKNLLILLSIIGWAGYARILAVSVAQMNRTDFVTAARLQGASAARILFKHILPNVRGPIIVLWSTSAGVLILAEAGLSFIGLGVQSPQFSWGSMLADSQNSLTTTWWEAVVPGLALTITVVSFNLLGDSIRDALNVRLSNR
jgi:peptide/nickel transport system permease protein